MDSWLSDLQAYLKLLTSSKNDKGVEEHLCNTDKEMGIVLLGIQTFLVRIRPQYVGCPHTHRRGDPIRSGGKALKLVAQNLVDRYT